MKILIAEDDRVSRQILTVSLAKWGHECIVTLDGAEAWAELQKDDAPGLAILDWMMPELDGVELIRRVRAIGQPIPTYIMLLTAKADKQSVVAGLQAGANDYLSKPVDLNELRARVEVGRQMVDLHLQLHARVSELERALQDVQSLRGLLPICCYCKKIRDDGDYWQEVEDYVVERADVSFSHGICPGCCERMQEEFAPRTGKLAIAEESEPELVGEEP